MGNILPRPSRAQPKAELNLAQRIRLDIMVVLGKKKKKNRNSDTSLSHIHLTNIDNK